MSADELAATEVRRMSREAERNALMTLDGLWEPESANAARDTKPVSVRLDAGTSGSPDILRIDQGAAFHESILLTPQVYRIIAGGIGRDSGRTDRYVVHAGGAGHDRVSVDRAALASIVAHERPIEMARAHRLVALERRAPTVHLAPAERIAQFEYTWGFDIVSQRIDAIVSKVSTRALMLLTGRDHVALWVQKDDLLDGPNCILGSALAAAIVSPAGLRTRQSVLVQGAGSAPGDPYIKHSFGSGPERSLIIDVAQVRKIVAGMPGDEARETALALFETLVDRSVALGRERAGRSKKGALRSRAAHA